VHRHRTNIQRWLREGMPYHEVPGNPAKLIREDDLTVWLRRKILANPARPKRAPTPARKNFEESREIA